MIGVEAIIVLVAVTILGGGYWRAEDRYRSGRMPLKTYRWWVMAVAATGVICLTWILYNLAK